MDASTIVHFATKRFLIPSFAKITMSLPSINWLRCSLKPSSSSSSNNKTPVMQVYMTVKISNAKCATFASPLSTSTTFTLTTAPCFANPRVVIAFGSSREKHSVTTTKQPALTILNEPTSTSWNAIIATQPLQQSTSCSSINAALQDAAFDVVTAMLSSDPKSSRKRTGVRSVKLLPPPGQPVKSARQPAPSARKESSIYKCLTSFSSMKALQDHWQAVSECGHAASSGSITDFMSKAKRVTTPMLVPSSNTKPASAREPSSPLADFLLRLDCLELPEGFVDGSNISLDEFYCGTCHEYHAKGECEHSMDLQFCRKCGSSGHWHANCAIGHVDDDDQDLATPTRTCINCHHLPPL
eukprot:TRINITY_DN12269_c1_g1_i8.p1 TRINITY_DN12269_c1_g1~~TRINITY_DN12269_c1_g1_i8.p1  ORF type:complete len:355 (+),score=60.31 TRINITY_DN12269_c1_g1_i8:496-1560(+)